MKPMLLKYCLTIVFKKKVRERDEKMACQRSMTQKKEKKMACQRSMTQQIKSDMKRSMYLSVHYPNQFINMSINMWIQSLTLQQI